MFLSKKGVWRYEAVVWRRSRRCGAVALEEGADNLELLSGNGSMEPPLSVGSDGMGSALGGSAAAWGCLLVGATAHEEEVKARGVAWRGG